MLVDDNPLSLFDQLLIASMFIPIILTLVTLTLFLMVGFCTVLVAPFGTIAMWLDRRHEVVDE